MLPSMSIEGTVGHMHLKLCAVFIAVRKNCQNAEKTSEIRREEERIQWDTLPGRTKRRIEEEEGPQEPTASDRKIDANMQ